MLNPQNPARENPLRDTHDQAGYTRTAEKLLMGTAEKLSYTRTAQKLLHHWSDGDPDRALARLVRQLTVTGKPRRMELRYAKGEPPLLTVTRGPDGTITSSHASCIQWTHNPLPDPQNPLNLFHPTGVLIIAYRSTRKAVQDAVLSNLDLPQETARTPEQHGVISSIREIVANYFTKNHRVSQTMHQAVHAVVAIMNPKTYRAAHQAINPEDNPPFGYHDPFVPVTPWRYNAAALLGNRLQELIKSNPGPTTWALRTTSEDEPLTHPGQVITLARDSLDQAGLDPRNWRFFTRLPQEVVQAVTHLPHRPDRLQAAAAALNLMAEARAVPDPTTADACCTQLCPPDRPGTPGTGPTAPTPNTLLALRLTMKESDRRYREPQAEAYWAGRADADPHILARQTADIMDFVRAQDQAGVTIHSRSWNGLIGQSHDWHRAIAGEELQTTLNRRAAQGLPLLRWHSLLQAQRHGHLLVVPLDTEELLISHGIEMHHCAGRYAGRCADGHTRIFSIQEGAQPLATMELQLNRDQWTLGQVRGAHNDEPTPAAHKAALKTAQAYTIAWNSTAPGARHPEPKKK